MASSSPTRILFVCLGNICRSPLAEGILKREALTQGVAVSVDSAGTGDWHTGQLPDRRAQQVGKARGCEMTMRARQVRAEDFERFDLMIAMDRSNFADLRRLPGADPSKVHLAMSFVADSAIDEVPDPYYGDLADFEEVADLLERACTGILLKIRKGDSRT